jgi:ABC-type glycerol-3-phosphate transport system substrate-binding protein
MKKIFCLLLALGLVLSASFMTACGGNRDEGVRVSLLWDELAFLLGDDLEDAIAADEAAIASGAIEDDNRTRALIGNTKIMQELAAEKGITISSLSMGWNDSLTTALMSCIWMQDGPDIIQGEEQLPKFIEDGYIEPFPDALAAKIREKCSPLAYKGLETDGKLYGFAIQPGLDMLFWNKTVLRQAGYTDADTLLTEGPRDWAEWEEAMDKVNKVNGESNNPHGGGVYVAANSGGYLRMGALLDSNGAYYADASGAPSLNTAESVEAFDFVRRMRGYNINGICNGMDYFSTYNKAFSQGNIAYKVDGNWAMQELEEGGVDFGCALLPPRVENERQGTMTLGACYMSVPKYSKHKEEAFYLLECMLDERIHENIASWGFRIPVLKSVVESESYAAEHPTEYAVARYALDNPVRGLPPFSGSVSEIWKSVGTALGASFQQNINRNAVVTAVNTAQAAMVKAYNA